MATWYKEDRGKWCYHFQIKSKRYSGYCIDPDTGIEANTKRQADSIETIIRDRISKRPEIKPAAGGVSFAEAMAFYIKNSAIHLVSWPGVKPQTEELLKFFGAARDVTTIDDELIAEYTLWSRKRQVPVWMGGNTGEKPKFKSSGKTRSNETVNKYLKTLKKVLMTPMVRKVMPVAPEIKLLKVPKRIPTPIAFDTLAEKIMPAAADHLQKVIALCTYTGMRETECLTVRARQWNEQQRVIFLDETTKSRKGRPVYVHEKAFQVIKRCLDDGRALWARLQGNKTMADKYARQWGIHGQQDIPLILYTPEGTDAWPRPVKRIQHAWLNALERAGLAGNIRFHDTRASFCTYLAHSGASPLDIKDLAGHEDIKTTMRYIGGAVVRLREATDKNGEKYALTLAKSADQTRRQNKTADNENDTNDLKIKTKTRV